MAFSEYLNFNSTTTFTFLYMRYLVLTTYLYTLGYWAKPQMEVGETSRITTSNSPLIPALVTDKSLRRSTTIIYCPYTKQIHLKNLSSLKKSFWNDNIIQGRNTKNSSTEPNAKYSNVSPPKLLCPSELQMPFAGNNQVSSF